MNFNGFNALCCELDGCVQIPWEQPPNKQFSVWICFQPDTTAINGILISFDSILCVKIADGHIQLTGKNFDHISDEIVLQRCYNTVVVTCDGKNISVYCNDALALKQEMPLGCDRITHLRIGENLSAVCIYNVTIFHRFFNQQEIHTNLVKKFSDFHRQIDFTSFPLPQDVILQKCRIENCVYTLDCSSGRVTMSKVHFPKEFTLIFSGFFLKQKNQELVLFKSPHMCINLYCSDFGSGSPHVQIKLNNNKTFFLPYVIKTKQWTNLTFVFSNSKLTVYFDGKYQGDSDYEAFVEVGEIEFGQFDGFLDNCVIIKGALSQNEISNYLNQPPSVFDQNVLYLFDFSDKGWQESCHGTALTPSGAKIILARETGASILENKSKCAPQSNQTYSDFVNWQIQLLIRLLVNWIYAQLGVYPNKGVRRNCDPWEIERNLHHFIHNKILSMKEAQVLLCHYDKLNSQELLDLIVAMKKNGTFKKLIDYLYQDDDNQYPVSDILLALLAAAALLAALLAAIDKMPSIPKPPKPSHGDSDNDNDDDDDDENKKKTYVSIKQISLKGDLEIDFDQKANPQDGEETAVFFVQGNSSNHCLEASFSYKGDEGEFTIFAENENSKVLPSSQQNVSFSGNNPIKITLNVHPQKFDRKYGKCTETLRWRCESSDGEQMQFLGETSYEFYFLENAPCDLWNKTVHIECLKLCADCAEYVGEKSEGFVEDYAKFIKYKNTVNECSSDSISAIAASSRTYRKSYSKMPTSKGEKYVFDAINFARDFRRGNCNIAYRDLVYSNAVFSYLNGYQDIKVQCLSANMSYWSFDGKRISPHLLIKDPNKSGNFYCLKDILHYVITDANNKTYDFELGSYGLNFSDNKERAVTGKNNSEYYRESMYLEGSYCEIIYTIDSKCWTLDDLSVPTLPVADSCEINNLPDNPIVGWVIRRNDGEYAHYNRTDNDWDVWRYISARDGNGRGTAVCHSISSMDIDMCIARICNNNPNARERQMGALIEALYPGTVRDQFTEMYYRFTRHLAVTLNRCLAQGNNYTDEVISHFCRLAANSPGNLRLANGRWNSATGAAFDPKSWFYYNGDPNGTCITSERALDVPCARGRLITTLKRQYAGIPDFPDNQRGFYLPDKDDGKRIHKMKEAGLNVNLIYKSVRDPGPVFYPLIFSSNNQFEYEEGRDKYIEFVNTRIFYRDPNSAYGWRALNKCERRLYADQTPHGQT